MLAAAVTLSATGTALAIPTPADGLTNDLRESQTCMMCHSHPNAMEHAEDPLYSPFITWQGTMMANAARDPVFWAGVALADQDHPGETEDCIRCHSPRAFFNNRGSATEITDLQPEDFDSVTCELCHRMMDDSPNPLGNARYAIDDVLAGGSVARRGPWDDYVEPDTPPHAWIADPFTGSSELCGTCHDVSTERPRLDDDGSQIAANFNEQRTYSEWAGSAYAVEGDDFRSCQDCHMPAVADMAACQAFVDFNSHPEGGRRHDLVGANRFMLQMLQQEYGSAGTDEVADFYFDVSIERVDEFLATAASVEVAGPASVDLGQGLDGLEVTVTNNSGHKLPSGYSEGRIMWIEVEATYGETVVYSSGAFEAGVGPTDDGQLRTYEGVANQLSSGVTQHLLLNDHWAVDTRIPPLGLTPNLETDPVTDRYELGGDGTWPNFDVAPYSFAAAPDLTDATPDNPDDDELTVTARVWYLINTPDYIQLLADDNKTNEAGSDIAMLFDAAGGAPPMLLAEAELMIPIDGFGASTGTTGTAGTADDTAGPVDDTSDDAPVDTTNGEVPTGPGNGSTSIADTDTEGPSQDDDGGGCSCSTEPRPLHVSWLLLGALGLTRRRRARGTRSPRRA